VCNDKATGYQFNAMTCEGCKGFFRWVSLLFIISPWEAWWYFWDHYQFRYDGYISRWEQGRTICPEPIL